MSYNPLILKLRSNRKELETYIEEMSQQGFTVAALPITHWQGKKVVALGRLTLSDTQFINYIHLTDWLMKAPSRYPFKIYDCETNQDTVLVHESKDGVYVMVTTGALVRVSVLQTHICVMRSEDTMQLETGERKKDNPCGLGDEEASEDEENYDDSLD